MKLHDKIVAVEQATGPSRQIDCDVIELLDLDCKIPPALTQSVDDALSTMPLGWRLNSLSDRNDTHRDRCVLVKPGYGEHARVVGYGCNRASATLAAILRAKAYDRGSPAPASTEYQLERLRVIQPERPTLRIHV